jgi:hypothetical protein
MAKKHFSQALNFDPDYKAAKQAFNSLKALERAKNRAQKALDAGGGAGQRGAQGASSQLCNGLMIACCQGPAVCCLLVLVLVVMPDCA